MNVAPTDWCKLSVSLHGALDPKALGTLAIMLGDYMIHSKMIPDRQQTVANIGNQERQRWQL